MCRSCRRALLFVLLLGLLDGAVGLAVFAVGLLVLHLTGLTTALGGFLLLGWALASFGIGYRLSSPWTSRQATWLAVQAHERCEGRTDA